MSNNRPLCNNSKQQYLNNNLYQDRRIFLRTVGGGGREGKRSDLERKTDKERKKERKKAR